MAAAVSQTLVDELVPVLQTIDMSIVSAIRSQTDLHEDMERLASDLIGVSERLEAPPDSETAMMRLVALRRRLMTLQKRLRALEESVHKIMTHLRAFAPKPNQT